MCESRGSVETMCNMYSNPLNLPNKLILKKLDVSSNRSTYFILYLRYVEKLQGRATNGKVDFVVAGKCDVGG